MASLASPRSAFTSVTQKLKEENSILRLENQALEEQQKQYAYRVMQLEQELFNQNHQFQFYKSEVEMERNHFLERNERLREDNKRLQEENERLQVDNERLREERETDHSKIDELEAEVVEKSSYITRKLKEIQSLRDYYHHLQTDLETANDQIKHLTAYRERLYADNVEMRIDLGKPIENY